MKSPKGFRGKYFSLAAILALSATITLANETKSYVDTKKSAEAQEEFSESEELTPPSEELDVVVISKKIKVKEVDAPFASEIYTKKQIKKSRAKDIYEFLNTQSSVVTIPSYGNIFTQSIDMRGYGIGDGYQNVVVSVNGRRLNNIDMTSQLLSSIPLESIEQIEIIKGSGSVEYGDGANAGAINIITKGYEGAAVKAYTGSNGLQFASIGLGIKKEKFSISGYIDDYSHNGYKTIANEGTKDDSWSRNKEIKGTFTPIENLTLNLGKSFSKMQIKYPNALTLAQYNQDPYFTPIPKVEWWGTEQDYKIQSYYSNMLNYGLNYQLNQNILFDFQGYDENKDSTYESVGGSFPSKDISHYDNKAYNTKINFKNKDFKIVLGLDSFEGNRDSYGNLVTKNNLGYYATLKYNINNQNSFSIGSRYEKIKYEHNDGINILKDDIKLNAFDIGYNYTIDKFSSFFISINKSFQSPDIDRFFTYNFATSHYEFNGFIEPVKVKTLNTGYNYIGYPNKFKIATFYSDIEDEIYYTGSVNTNFDKTRKYGLEIYDKYNILYNLFITLNYSYVNTNIKENSINPAVEGNNIPGVSKHNIKFALGYNPTHRINLLLSHVYKSKAYSMSDIDGSFGKMEAYNSTDFSATYKYKKYEFFAKVNNLFDKKNALFADDGTTLGVYPVNYERNFMIGMSAKF
ncbi:TonB-dependent receptor plug domain-containing protein [Sulfurospirillum arcachonense]|uniref:TonB-dependent receptor plug domain-containing protein n=1 Tax=Sulfurospirillum arcachonense TaxID=57666 RepID=UPI000468D069|nr:TonB-dependent receptor [Sulfurospirillum arcachonense]